MKWKSFMATANLAIHFALRLLKRLFFIRSAGLKGFVEFYRSDRIAIITQEEKELQIMASRCTSCGFCETSCPALAPLSAEGFLRPSFIAHWSRSIPDFAGTISLPVQTCEVCKGCESVCPEQIPLKKLVRFIEVQSEKR